MDSNDKILLSGSNVSLDLSQDVINLRGIPNDFAARCLRNLLIVAPTRFNKKTALCGLFIKSVKEERKDTPERQAHLCALHENEVCVNNWRAWRIREYAIRKITKIAGTRFL